MLIFLGTLLGARIWLHLTVRKNINCRPCYSRNPMETGQLNLLRNRDLKCMPISIRCVRISKIFDNHGEHRVIRGIICSLNSGVVCLIRFGAVCEMYRMNFTISVIQILHTTRNPVQVSSYSVESKFYFTYPGIWSRNLSAEVGRWVVTLRAIPAIDEYGWRTLLNVPSCSWFSVYAVPFSKAHHTSNDGL